jgi:hypothetical protein
MSDDIVTRLRERSTAIGAPQPSQLCDEAADEIERLRTLLDNILERENKNNLNQLEIVRKVEADRDYWHERGHRAEKCLEFNLNKKWWKR